MKTLLFTIAAIIATLFTSATYAQDFYGTATYVMKLNSSGIKLEENESVALSDDISKLIDEQMKNMSQTFTLRFDKTSSYYDEVIKKQTVDENAGFQIFMGGETSDIIYRNLKTNTYVNQKEFFDKTFLIKGTVENQNWKLSNETKKIGKYTCYKATRKVEADKNDKDSKPGVYIVWYTKEIPVGHGPDFFFGLPGLILEANDGTRTFLCSKVVLNPKEKLAIKEPQKGKVTTEKEFAKIEAKKLKEMEKDSDGLQFEVIRVN